MNEGSTHWEDCWQHHFECCKTRLENEMHSRKTMEAAHAKQIEELWEKNAKLNKRIYEMEQYIREAENECIHNI